MVPLQSILVAGGHSDSSKCCCSETKPNIEVELELTRA